MDVMGASYGRLSRLRLGRRHFRSSGAQDGRRRQNRRRHRRAHLGLAFCGWVVGLFGDRLLSKLLSSELTFIIS